METLVKELEAYKQSLSAEEKVKLSDAVLDKLYAVYPFNKFEYTISHLIAKENIHHQQMPDKAFQIFHLSH